MRILTKQVRFIQAAALVLVVGIAPSVWADTDRAVEKTETSKKPLIQNQKSALKDEKKPTKRLRFRDGPVCMCADGLTENDILESQKRTRKKLEIIEKNEGRQP
jgi:hypothetical protein